MADDLKPLTRRRMSDEQMERAERILTRKRGEGVTASSWFAGHILAALFAERAEVGRLEAANRQLREALRDVAHSGIEFNDARLGYVTMQIDRLTLDYAERIARQHEGA